MLNLDAAIDWRVEGPRYRDHMVATLEGGGYIGFGDAIEVEHLTTLLDWLERGMKCSSPFASAHSFLVQMGPFRPGNRWGEYVVFTGSGTPAGRRRAHGADLGAARGGADRGAAAALALALAVRPAGTRGSKCGWRLVPGGPDEVGSNTCSTHQEAWPREASTASRGWSSPRRG